MNLATLLDRAGRGFADRPALAAGARVLCDYRALAGRAAALAGGLRGRLGLAPGDRVALVMRNSPEYVELLFACWHAGLTAVPVNARLAAAELRYILDHSGALACFVTPDLAAAVGGVAGSEAVIAVGSADWKRMGAGDGTPQAEVQPDDVAWLFYTSGTTGRPKGAMLTHRNLLAMSWGYFADVDSVAPGDSILHAAPMSHGSGFYILPHVAAGALQVVPESAGFEPDELFRLFAAHDGATVFAAPTMVRRLVAHAEAHGAAPAGLKTVVYGGGPMYVEDCKRAIAALDGRLAQIYGQGESPMTITSLARHRFPGPGEPRYEARLASVGMPFSIVEIRIVDSDDTPLPPGETGEILVRGDPVMRGYWENPEATAETLRGGWLHTGDIGVLDADGYLTLKDRSKDVIISGGANIYPREVEEVLLGHPGVREASVIGRPDPDWGESVLAFVVAGPGGAVSAADLDRLCLDRIARFKRPREYRFVDALPKNNYGKVLKTALREMVEGAD
ncbi:MAG: AMP-binding protein [Alphaproteobacteria bacterium]|nr:AMP-binding protein [Alphaproteobacteria bacterium]